MFDTLQISAATNPIVASSLLAGSRFLSSSSPLSDSPLSQRESIKRELVQREPIQRESTQLEPVQRESIHHEPARLEGRLPFTIRVVADDDALERALNMRQAAYERHVPEFAQTMNQPEVYDREPGSLVLLAESKLDRSPIGTMRIQTNRFRQLSLEQSVQLPPRFSGRLVGATRLGVAAGQAGRMVKTALFKAFYLYCMREQIEWMLIAARSPLDRQYAALQFVDVFGDRKFIPLAHAANIPHRVMAFDVQAAERQWRESQHPLYEFVVSTNHPDIDLSAAPPLNWPDRTIESQGQSAWQDDANPRLDNGVSR